jgi:RimJ/RimL family protein N-acetyltransferase
VQIRMDPRNKPSEQVGVRVGFVFEGTLRNLSVDAQGVPRDRHIYALIPEDYAQLSWSNRQLF